MESFDIVLERAEKKYSDEEKFALAEAKNNLYREYIKSLTPSDILEGVMDNLDDLKSKGLKLQSALPVRIRLSY